MVLRFGLRRWLGKKVMEKATDIHLQKAVT